MRKSKTNCKIYDFFNNEIQLLLDSYVDYDSDKKSFVKKPEMSFWKDIKYYMDNRIDKDDFCKHIKEYIDQKNRVVDISFSDDILHIEIIRYLKNFEAVKDEFNFILKFMTPIKKKNLEKKFNELIEYYKINKIETHDNIRDIFQDHYMFEYFSKIFKQYEKDDQIEFENKLFSLESFVEFCEKYKFSIIKGYYEQNLNNLRSKYVREVVLTGATASAVGGGASCFISIFNPATLANIIGNCIVGLSLAGVVIGGSLNLDLKFKILEDLSKKFDTFIISIKSKYFVMGYEEGSEDMVHKLL